MKKASLSTLEKIILSLVLFLANLRALVFVFLFPDTSKLIGPAWIEIFLWALAAIGILYNLLREGQLPNYLAVWRRNWLILLFLLLAFLSLLWSVAPVSTLFRSLELFFATVVASYFGMRLSPERLMEALFWFGTVLFFGSIVLVCSTPPIGRMMGTIYQGSWNGIYWHRNHLASISAFLNIVYLYRLLIAFQKKDKTGLLDCFLYIFSLTFLYYARSATGYILWIALHLFVIIVLIWIRFSQYLKRIHYFFILSASVLAACLILQNLDFVFKLFNRDVTMTGRIGLWSHLLDLASRHPWLGHGFGAVWTTDSFREEIWQLVGWYYQPLIGDNGLLDIYLHLGFVGVLLFTSVLTLAIVRTFRYALAQRTMTSFFPLMVIIYAFVANISFSLFIETEVFIWFLIVTVLIVATPYAQASGYIKSTLIDET